MLQDLQVHGVMISRIVVTIPFSRLTKQSQEALLGIADVWSISLDFFADRLELSNGVLADNLSAQAKTLEDTSFSFSSARIKSSAERRFWKVKRAIDFAGAALFGLALFPLILAVAVLVAIDVGPQVIFWQERLGFRGRPFKLYKFRTMASAYDSEGNRLCDEDRLSVIGRLLRRLRFDELPQLYNIMVGEMSFVGPRPLLRADQTAAYAARLLVRPGLTGWAQIKGGRSIDLSDKAALDVWYVSNASFILDLGILVQTLPMVLLGETVNGDAIRRAWCELHDAGISSAGSLTAESDPVPS